MHRQLGREVRSLEERREEGEGRCRGGGGAVELHAALAPLHALLRCSPCPALPRSVGMHSWGSPLRVTAKFICAQLASGVCGVQPRGASVWLLFARDGVGKICS